MAEFITVISLKICRCCGNSYASDSEKMIQLFHPNFSDTHRILQNIIVEMNKWQLSISKNDRLPQYICNICFTKFVNYFNFRANCVSVHNQLLCGINKNATIAEVTPTKDIKCYKTKIELISNKSIDVDVLKTISDEKTNGSCIEQLLSGELFKNIEFVEMPAIDEQCLSERSTSAIDIPDNKSEENIVLDKHEQYDSAEDYLEESNNSTKETITYKTLKNNSLSCKYCCFNGELLSPSDVIFPTEAALLKHIESQHDPLSPYTCPICKKQHKTIKQCRHHILYQHKKIKTICQICGIECDYSSLKKHIKRHHTTSDFSCKICGKNFLNVSLAKFEYHQRWHKIKLQKKCKHCGKVFVQGVHLRVHMMQHTGDYNIYCEICDKGFRSQYAKGAHMHTAHDAEKPVKCLYCEERFTTYGKRVTHMIDSHDYIQDTVNEKLKCLKCNKVFRRETGFRCHIANDCQRLKRVQGNKTKQKSYWKSARHISCPHCSELFGKESALLKHLELHDEGRPFKCDICHLNYKTRSHLDLHKSIKHCTAKPFVCDICGKAYKVNFNLNSHKKTSHR